MRGHVADGKIGDGIARHGVVEAVAALGALAPHAGADVPAGQRATQAILAPDRKAVPRNAVQRLADVGGGGVLGDFAGDIGIGRRHAQAIAEILRQLKFQPARALFADGHAETGIDRIAAEHIGARQVERGQRQQAGLARHVELDAYLVLAALLGLEGRAAGIGAGIRQERRGEACVRPRPVRQVVHHARAAGDGVAVIVGTRRRQPVRCARPRGFVAHAPGHGPALPHADLVAQVKPQRIQGIGRIQAIGGRAADAGAVDRVVDVQRRDAAGLLQAVFLGVPVVDAEGHAVGMPGERKGTLHVGVDAERIAGKALLRAAAVHRLAVGGHGAGRYQRAGQRRGLVAQVLVQGPAGVEAMRQRVADAVLLAVIGRRIGFADKAVGRHHAIAVRHQRAVHGQALLAHVVALVVAGQDGEVGARAKVQRQRRREPAVAIPDKVGRIVAVHHQPVQAERRLAVLGQRRAHVDRHLPEAVVADGDAQFAEQFRARALADHVDQAAGLYRAEQDRGRPLEDFHALHAEQLLRHAVVAVDQQPVGKDRFRGALAADDEVVPAAPAEGIGDHAGGILQRVAEVLCLLAVEQVARDHGDRLRGVGRRFPRLGHASGAPRGETDVGLSVTGGTHRHGWQRGNVFGGVGGNGWQQQGTGGCRDGKTAEKHDGPVRKQRKAE
ncbi:putative Uncharacterised protein (plasmid) [Cupriavidus taiwanensis]|uniref:Uncharacterized protein n=1 Tax=Cupriavidus taiwanensis TaxID=164546 RepID=A0A7Z7JA84_9BURK|nr:protein of unknown function [Cupriavidus taiwanensis]SOZ13030.1 protein of unknown function [Cupriavidus taiwanensis]SOZ41534.1 protein of unknown function [Cupriavidus taiwanensis]SPC20939.1 protein of unknown function [Cupriavidus taiwanensis]SPD55081.1 putative Uncharacterised protein [Cupriavidus taiwanensis]